MHIPLVYQIWELFEFNPDHPLIFHHGYFLTRAAMEWKLNELNRNNQFDYTSYHVAELEFEDSFQQDMTNMTIH